jgi:hypothetical protein
VTQTAAFALSYPLHHKPRSQCLGSATAVSKDDGKLRSNAHNVSPPVSVLARNSDNAASLHLIAMAGQVHLPARTSEIEMSLRCGSSEADQCVTELLLRTGCTGSAVWMASPSSDSGGNATLSVCCPSRCPESGRTRRYASRLVQSGSAKVVGPLISPLLVN